MRRNLPLKLRAAVSELSAEEKAMLDAEEAGAPLPAAAQASGPGSDPFSMLDDRDEAPPKTQPVEGDSGGQPLPPEPEAPQHPPQIT